MPLLASIHHPTIVIVALAGLILWRLYSRVRRLIGRQRSRLWRHRGTMLFFPLLLGLLALGALGEPKALLSLAAGIAIGVGLALVGLRLSRFEVNADGFFYTPYAPIGIALSALFVARLIYRVTAIAESRLDHPGGLHEFVATPVTLLVFGTLASYYTAYALGLLRWRSRLAADAAPLESPFESCPQGPAPKP